MEFAAAVLVGFILGLFVYHVIRKPKTYGIIRAVQSDPDEPPYLFLELKTNVGDVMTRKFVTFEVSQK